MLQSMTGYGKVEVQYNNKPINIEIKSINSRQYDVNIRLLSFANRYRDKDIELRKLIQRELIKGKIDVYIHMEKDTENSKLNLNIPIAKQYIEQFKTLSDLIGDENNSDFLPLLINMPDVWIKNEIEEDSEEWKAILEGVNLCIDKVITFRKQEGDILEKDFLNRIQLILKYLDDIPAYESEREKQLKDKLHKNLASLSIDKSIDENRFEQELIYYLEKLDITEEKVRLKNHCDYFIETMNQDESNGKKLNFISQEIGREINTIGSKANHSDIQCIVVNMKDELEKIKEQLANIL